MLQTWTENDIYRLGSFLSAFNATNKLRGDTVVIFCKPFQELLVRRTLALVCPTMEMAYCHYINSSTLREKGKKNYFLLLPFSF